MIMIAVISDIQSNLEALESVFADISQVGASSIYCLGDVTGYGTNPFQCLQLALRFSVVLEGNNDRNLVDQAFPGFDERIHAGRTTSEFLETMSGSIDTEAIRELMLARPKVFTDANGQFVHGTILNPIDDALFPENVFDSRKMRGVFAQISNICFCGGTHLPGIFPYAENSDWRHMVPEEFGMEFDGSNCRLICNVGSVGQPRDGDERACYALLDGTRIIFRRVCYDISTTIRKIKLAYEQPT
ncbi:MAG: metallophosphoesterase family protein [Pirellulaceae bacterium]|nr:metallophosphoesterase family protein [Pirellulaceae bacterium]